MGFVLRSSDEGREKNIERLRLSGKPVAVYGTGKFGIAAAQYLIDNGIRILCFVDDNMYWKPGKVVELGGGTKFNCISEDDFSSITDVNLCSGIIDYRRCVELRNRYKEIEHVLYIDAVKSHMIQNDFLDKNKSILDEIYQKLDDEVSKKTMTEYISARYSGDVSELCKCIQNDYMYDWHLLSLDKNDIVIDGGAFDGDTVLEMMSCGNEVKPCRVYAFEPDKDNCMKLRNTVEKHHYDNINVINAGLYNSDTTLSFSRCGEIGASIDENGSESVKMIALDNHPEYCDATIVKMDIEGSEVAALSAAQSILANRPRLAICIYHRNEDLIDIYRILKKYEYSFFLRQHSYSVEETVLYAI